MLKLATLFHLNLMYSAIPAARRAEVIARCYHRVLDLAEGGVPVAVEASGLTLQMIAALDPRWVERLRGLLRSGHAEYVACGYSQIIGPLAPAGVNARNLDLGRRAARDLLGVEPELWLVNEMAWSGGLAALYRDAGARAVIMEWNNAWHAHPEWDGRWRWHWQRAQGPNHPDGAEVPVIWVDTFDFQKMQRLCSGDITRARELSAAGEASDESWRDLLFLWSSDLRTRLTGDRWADVAPRASLPRLAPLDDDGAPSQPSPATDGDLVLRGKQAELRLKPRRGLAGRAITFKPWGGGQAAGAELVDGDLRVRKEWLVDACAPMVTLRGVMDLPARRAAEIHPVHLTVVPGVFDAGSLGFAVRNGGRAREVFRFRDGPVHHGEAYSTLITAKGGLGATDGELLIGDDRHRLVLRHDPAVSALVPTVRFVPGRDGRYFLRVRWSAQEIDETFVAGQAPWHVAWVLSVTAENRGLADE